MKNNVIAFDPSRKPASSESAKPRTTADKGEKGNVVAIADHRKRVRRTAGGVFFSTGVLLTHGSAA